MKCPNCGAKYEGSRCPDCGRIADPRIEEKQRTRKFFWITAGIIAAIALISIGCYVLVFHNINQQIEEVFEDQNTDGVVSAVSVPEEEKTSEELPEIVSDLEAYLREQWDGEISVRVNNQKLDVVLSTTGEIPEFLDAAQAVASEINERSSNDPDVLGNTILVKSGIEPSDKIYLTFIDGNLSFRADEAEEYKESNDEFITMDEFNQIQTGMTYQEVVNIIGSAGELISSVDIGDALYKTEMYSWEGKGSIGANANVMFQGGIVSSKAQFGLE